MRADVLMITDGSFGEPPADFVRQLAEVKQAHPLRLVAVLIGSDEEQAQVFADKVITVSDLFADRDQLRSAVADVI